MAPKTRNLKTKSTKNETTDRDFKRLEKAYPHFGFRMPETGESHLSVKEGEICLFLRHLRDGLSLPVPGHLVVFLKKFGMVPAQLTPNAIAYLCGMWRFFSQWNVRWTIENLMGMITCGTGDRESYYIQVRNPSHFALCGTPASVHKWKNKFVFVSSKEAWGFSTEVKKVDLEAFKGWETSGPIQKLYNDMGCVFMELNVKTLVVATSCSPRLKITKGEKEPTTKKRKADEAEEEEDDEDDEEESSEEEALQKKRRVSSRSASKGKRALVEETSEEEAESPEGSAAEESSAREEAEDRGQQGPAAPEKEGGEGEVGASESREVVVDKSGKTPNCWWDDEEGTFTFRYNEDFDIIPRMGLTNVPAKIIIPLVSDGDRKYLNSLSGSRLLVLQNQLAFGGAMVAKHISDISRGRELALRSGAAREAELEGQLKETQKLVDKLKDELRDQKNSSLIENNSLSEQITELNL